MGDVDGAVLVGVNSNAVMAHGHRQCQEGASHQQTVQHAAIAPAAACDRSAAYWRSLMPGLVPSTGGLWR
jgi:hypothetical protein